MTIIYRDTELDDIEDRRYYGTRSIHDTGRVQIGIAHTRRQANDEPIKRHTSRRITARLVLITVVVFVVLAMWRCVS